MFARLRSIPTNTAQRLFFAILTAWGIFFLLAVTGVAAQDAAPVVAEREQLSAVLAFISEIRGEYGTAGWAAAVGAFWYGCIAVFRLPISQKLIVWASAKPKCGWLNGLVWKTWPTYVKVLVVAVPTGLGAFFSTLADQASVAVALAASVGALVTAMGGRKVQKLFVDTTARKLVGKKADPK